MDKTLQSQEQPISAHQTLKKQFNEPKLTLIEPKLTFIEPKLTKHGDVTKITQQGFFGTFSP